MTPLPGGLNVVVVGQGYVGLALAMRAVDAGHSVVGYELDDGRVKRLAAASSHVEDVPDDELAAALATQRYKPTSRIADCGEFDVCVIAVPTPLRDGVPDLSHIEEAGAAIASHLRAGATVVLESTTYPGTTEELLVPILEEGSGLTAGTDFHVGYSPERIDPGNRTWTLANTPKVVSGIDAASLHAVQGFYDTFVNDTVPISGTKEAELTKLLENTFRHVNIALVNELAILCDRMGIDIWEVVDAAGTKPYGFMRFDPGPGMGGHCLPVDPFYLSWKAREYDLPIEFVELAGEVNQKMPYFCVDRITRALNEHSKAVRGSKVAIIGVSYKPGVGDLRESPALKIVKLLAAAGAEVVYHDEHVAEVPELGLSAEPLDAVLDGADVAAIVTAHPGVDVEHIVRSAPLVVDFRGVTRGIEAPNLVRL